MGKTKYEFESTRKEPMGLIIEEVSKIRTLFSSVQKGTNIHYLDLVKECTQEIMGILIRKNTTLSFAKNTEKVRKDLFDLLSNNYKHIMNDLGEKLVQKVVVPLERKYKLEEKIQVKS